ncbi:hypothetical protein BLOT_004675 [Blomia tropicalis]|nr:hypothetical protein BLOT_004675 [Blomia tropicalis]
MSNKTPKSQSPKRSKSGSKSKTSIGIGTEKKKDRSSRRKHISTMNMFDHLCDCIVTLIYCPEHQKIAIRNTRRENILWAPFLPLSETMSWTDGTEEAVQIATEPQDNEVESSQNNAQPKYDTEYFEVTQIQTPSVNHINRVVQLITLKHSAYKCCKKTRQLEWIPLDTLVKKVSQQPEPYNNHWGPELQMWCAQLQRRLNESKLSNNSNKKYRIYRELTLNDALCFYSKAMRNSAEHKATKGLHFKIEHAIELYENFLRHCYPSVYMYFESFRIYMIKYRFDVKEGTQRNVEEDETTQLKQLTVLYELIRSMGKHDYIEFHHLLIALVVMDPTCKDKCEARIRMLFRHYGAGKDHFTETSLQRLVNDMAESADSANKLNIAQVLKMFSVTTAEKITFTVFYKAIMNQSVSVSHLLRFSRSVLAQVSPQFGHKVDQKRKKNSNANVNVSSKSVSSVGGKQCFACSKKNYEYGIHAVTIDTLGRCSNPRIITEALHIDSYYPEKRKYSLEFTFSDSTIGNVCRDLVKAFNRSREQRNTAIGLLSGSAEDLLKYLSKLCQHLGNILKVEPKLIKLNGPAIVIGDLHGNLNDLLSIETALFPSFPVIPENIIFLGNYTGDFPYGVECLIYLFALKVIEPNKVFILRGNAERRFKATKTFRRECINKYGRVNGDHVFEAFDEIFATLPIAIILDETILCVSSGIPHGNKRITDLNNLPKSIVNVQKEAPMVYEILTRYPLSSNATRLKAKSLMGEFMGERDGDSTLYIAQQSDTTFTDYNSRSYSECLKSGIKSVDPTQLKVPSMRIRSAGQLSHLLSSPITSYDRPSVISAQTQGSKRSAGNKPKTLKRIQSIPSITKKRKSRESLHKTQRNVKVEEKFQFQSNSSGSISMKHGNVPNKSSETFGKHRRKSSIGNLEINEAETFDGKSFHDFMSFNHLQYLIRGSSLCKLGFKATFNNRCLSVISCSNLSDSKNEAAVILVNREMARIRVINLTMTDSSAVEFNSNSTLGQHYKSK